MNPALLNWEHISPAAPWANSIGMKFVPVPGTQVLFCIWLTRMRDYEAYAGSRPKIDPRWSDKTETYGLPISESPEHPVCNVSWNDAKAFCEWLSEREQRSNVLSPKLHYRLPTDVEWSRAVGLDYEAGKTPEEKSDNMEKIFPWGTQWPPPRGAGNFADETLRAQSQKTAQPRPHIAGYDDGFATTSPVGSFPPNRYGLYDLSGNLLEWCEDLYSPEAPGFFIPDYQKVQKVLRGGAWISDDAFLLLSGLRYHEGPGVRTHYIGFRVVLAGLVGQV